MPSNGRTHVRPEGQSLSVRQPAAVLERTEAAAAAEAGAVAAAEGGALGSIAGAADATSVALGAISGALGASGTGLGAGGFSRADGCGALQARPAAVRCARTRVVTG